MKSSSRAEFERQALPLLDSLYRTAFRLTGQDASAQDLVQETVLRGYRSFDQYAKGTNFRAWMFRILTNTYINDYRRRVRGPQPADLAEIDPSDPRDVEFVRASDLEALTDQLGDDARRAIEKLPAEFRLIFLLSTFEGFTYKEIAEIAGIPIGTVMSRLFRARSIVRSELLSAVRGRTP